MLRENLAQNKYFNFLSFYSVFSTKPRSSFKRIENKVVNLHLTASKISNDDRNFEFLSQMFSNVFSSQIVILEGSVLCKSRCCLRTCNSHVQNRAIAHVRNKVILLNSLHAMKTKDSSRKFQLMYRTSHGEKEASYIR